MKNVQKIDLGLTGYDELFANDEERKVNKLPRIFDIPISEIDDFPDHPFKVKIDEDMDQLVQSIKERGIITPVTLRPKEDGRYEIVSGHRRKKACEIAGLDTVKAEVREMSRDEAIILMVESNLQRSTILPSEKAFSYKMRLEAMNRQGQRSDLTCGPVDHKLDGVKSRDIIADSTNESARQVSRYIRLTELIPPLLDLVDEGRIAFRPAVELSYLKKEEQEDLLEEISYADATPSLAQAIKMKRFSQEGKLSNEVIESIMSEEKPNQKEKIRIKYEDARRFIPDSVPYNKTGEYIQRLTTNLFKNTTPKGSQTQDPFWDQTAAMLLKALVCYLHYEAPPDEQNFPMVMEMIRAGDVKENNEDYLSVLDELFERLEAKNPEHIALKYYRAYHSGSAKTLKSIQISLVSRLEKFNLDSLAGITQTDEMDLGEIGERKTAVFAVIPDNDSSFNFIVGMLYTQLFQQLYYQADSVHGGRLPVHVHFVMDEFANVALPDEFDKLLSTIPDCIEAP